MFKLNGNSYEIPEWILNRLSQQERYAWSVGDGEYVKRETEKAVLVAQMTDFGRVECWCPKSVLLTEEQVKAETAKAEAAWEAGCKYNTYLRTVAKDNGVKIGNLRRTEAIAKKLESKGVEFMSKAEFLK